MAGATAGSPCFQPDEQVLSMLPVKAFEEGKYVVFTTRNGTIKKTALDAFANIRATGIKAAAHPLVVTVPE